MVERVTETLDFTDWAEEMYREEVDLPTFDAVETEIIKNGVSPQQMGRMAVAGRLIGLAAHNLVPPTKLLVATGATRAITEQLAQRKETIETDEGKKIRVRKYVAPVPDSKDEPTSEPWVEQSDPRALELAERYLLRSVPGHIRSRLNIIAANSGDVERVADALKREIDDMVEVLTAEVEE